MITSLTAPFFEIGPKNLLRRDEIARIAAAAGQAGQDYGVTVLLTVPTAYIAPVHELGTGVSVYAQGMDADRLGSSLFRVTAEALADAGAAGVMINHAARPLQPAEIELSLQRCAELGLQIVVCAGTEPEAIDIASLGPTAVLFEPGGLIGTSGIRERGWISASSASIHRTRSAVLAMHAGGVATPEIARAIMLAGADGTGSTSGILDTPDPAAAARSFIAATREGWDHAPRP